MGDRGSPTLTFSRCMCATACRKTSCAAAAALSDARFSAPLSWLLLRAAGIRRSEIGNGNNVAVASEIALPRTEKLPFTGGGALRSKGDSGLARMATKLPGGSSRLPVATLGLWSKWASTIVSLETGSATRGGSNSGRDVGMRQHCSFGEHQVVRMTKPSTDDSCTLSCRLSLCSHSHTPPFALRMTNLYSMCWPTAGLTLIFSTCHVG
mmetsp:Transcript_57226/g.94615  ORF Transcript_57226/g.94615 Transcript_57226/m.94615 type:complete len:209 (+) Transcript_57226:370-996(+)